ncbi:MAG: hypothetical protein M1818_004382 [Claussenomyces sp. TS43310]|nr:MAG: hypothetical protein M1818_004382 [Claussenomyces sp. TS43310]
MAYTSPPHPSYYGFTSATPSPSGPHGFYQRPGATSPRGHAYHASADFAYSSPPRYASPRYSSAGYYSTRAGYPSPGGEADYVSAKTRKSPHKYRGRDRDYSWSTPKPRPTRRFSQSYRASHGDSDDDEYIVYDGHIYVIPGRRLARNYYTYRGHGTNRYSYQGFAFDRHGTPIIVADPVGSPRYDTDLPPRPKSRRPSASTPTPRRPSTATPRPSSSARKAPPSPPKATEADARKHHIPPGYSLKSWDPTEEPIMLLGSVFDANSLGKWIYDWTVYHHGPATPISDMAGELWLLLIQLAGKVKRAEECMPRIRLEENREMVDDFIESGDRLTDKLQKLLRACEAPMLKAGKRHGKESVQLGKNSGIEFVDSIFGRDRQLENTEKFMASIRLWNLRFDANCEDIIRRPHA